MDCVCVLNVENKHPEDYFNSSEQMCAIVAHVIMLSTSQKSGFLSSFSITGLEMENLSGKMPDSFIKNCAVSL